jgi:hypothetical protein
MHTWTNQIDAESVLMEKRVAFHLGKLRGQAAHGWVQLPRSWQIAAAAFSSRRSRGALWLRSAGISSSGAGTSCSGMIWVVRRVRCPGQREVPESAVTGCGLLLGLSALLVLAASWLAERRGAAAEEQIGARPG